MTCSNDPPGSVLYDHLYSVTTVPTPLPGYTVRPPVQCHYCSYTPPGCTVRPSVQCHYCFYTPARVYCTTTCTVSLLLLHPRLGVLYDHLYSVTTVLSHLSQALSCPFLRCSHRVSVDHLKTFLMHKLSIPPLYEVCGCC